MKKLIASIVVALYLLVAVAALTGHYEYGEPEIFGQPYRVASATWLRSEPPLRGQLSMYTLNGLPSGVFLISVQERQPDDAAVWLFIRDYGPFEVRCWEIQWGPDTLRRYSVEILPVTAQLRNNDPTPGVE